jgi:predicted GH43/DUF377 family glycosyl hydrolase
LKNEGKKMKKYISFSIFLVMLIGIIACSTSNNESQVYMTPTFAVPQGDVHILSPEEAENLSIEDESMTEQNHESGFMLYNETPVFATSGRNWDRLIVSAPVFFYNGNFYMLYSGIPDVRTSAAIGQAASHDGVSWQQVNSDPVFTADLAPGSPFSVIASSLVIGDESGRVSNWYMYYSTIDSNAQISTGSIGHAIAIDPVANWISVDEYALHPGENGAWDELAVGDASVIKTRDGYVMYYLGTNRNRRTLVGMATSDDGYVWTKYDNPETTDDAYVMSDPVFFGRSPNWSETQINAVEVIQLRQDEWAMIYAARDTNNRNQGVGYALSPDGIHWEQSAENPIIVPADFEQGVFIIDVHLAMDDDTVYIYIVVLHDNDSTAVYLATVPR